MSDRRVRQLIARGATDLVAIADACGAGSYCGGCAPTLRTLLATSTGAAETSLVGATPASASPATPEQRGLRAVVRALEEDVIATEWIEGQHLADRAGLAQRYGCTPATVDRAAWVLEQHGILNTSPRLRIGIPAPRAIAEAAALHLQSAGVETAHLVSTRRMVEEVVAGRAAARVKTIDREGKHLLTTVASAEDALDMESALDFHVVLAAASGSPALRISSECLSHVARLLLEDERSVRAADADELAQRRHQIATEHAEIARAVLAGDSDGARELMGEHIEQYYSRSELSRRRDPATQPTGSSVHGQGRSSDGHGDADSPMVVAQLIARDIRAQTAEPGDVLTDHRALLARYGLRPRQIRKALTLLEYYSVAQQLPGPTGDVVVLAPDPWPAAQLLAMYLDHSQASPRDLLEVRSPLEVAAIQAIARRARLEDREALQQRRAEEQVAVARAGSLQASGWGLHDIHAVVGAVSGDASLRLLISALATAFARGIPRWVAEGTSSSPLAALSEDHDRIIEAVASADARAAGALMAEHLLRIHARVSL